MRVILTGLNGTLAPVLADELHAQGHEVIAWNREQTPPEDAERCLEFLQSSNCDAIAHLAMGSEHWAALLACYCYQDQLPFVYTSTAMVFDRQPNGPHRPNDLRTARDDYGQYKIRCEDAILAENPHATIARIGYQINLEHAQGNNMYAHLQQQAQQGVIRASTAWIPACSFMQDTAQALIKLLQSPTDIRSGTHHLDSNAHNAYNYFQIVQAIKQQTGSDWQIEATTDYHHDQRLLDDTYTRISLPSLQLRLPSMELA